MNSNDQTAQKQSKVKKKFTPTEDAKIMLLVDRFGIHSWKKIACFLEDRTARQCRERWKHYLDKKPIKKEWTNAEDEKLLKLHKNYGPKWTEIAKQLDGRTSINVKNRFALLTRHKKKEEASKISSKYEFLSDTTEYFAAYLENDSVENTFM